ncbi:MAG: DUF3179 domain-containing protein [Candidatus Latescibacteria bacterium]|nr:DUF3179 domain-containing protein [Candidatus Latescibacterota bacterium]
MFLSVLRTAALLALLAACAQLPPPVPSTDQAAIEQPARRNKPVFLVDRQGERFDISHAVEKYKMNRRGFEFGIGKNAIRPIDQPDMIEPGQRDYPADWARHRVIGLELAGEVRSYPIRELTRHEIVNETLGQTQAAVAY